MSQIDNWIKEFNGIFPDRKILFLCKAGSHFFNLNTSNSDTDYKGIYLPSPKEFYEGESRRRFYEKKTQNVGKNNKDDFDLYLYSLTQFYDLLGKGDFNCMELLFCPKNKIIQSSEYYQNLVNMRESLLVNDISSFLGFIKKEYRRYGVNINHYGEQLNLLNYLKTYPQNLRLSNIWENLKKYSKNNTFIKFTVSETGKKGNYIPSIKIAQRLYQNTVKIEYVVNAIENRLNSYGHRQKNMAINGKEYKGLYHALRLIYEANDLLSVGKFKIPFDEDRHNILLSIKKGEVEQDWLFNLIDSEIDSLQNIENKVKSNSKQVVSLIDKLKFYLIGSNSINYVMGDFIEK